jgi:hypothetical protein
MCACSVYPCNMQEWNSIFHYSCVLPSLHSAIWIFESFFFRLIHFYLNNPMHSEFWTSRSAKVWPLQPPPMATQLFLPHSDMKSVNSGLILLKRVEISRRSRHRTNKFSLAIETFWRSLGGAMPAGASEPETSAWVRQESTRKQPACTSNNIIDHTYRSIYGRLELLFH